MILCWLRRFRAQQRGVDRGTKKYFFFFFCKYYKHQQGADLIKSENSIKVRLWHFAIWEKKKKTTSKKKKKKDFLCSICSLSAKQKRGSGLHDWLSRNQINYREQRREAPDALGRFQSLIGFCSQTQRKVFEIFFFFGKWIFLPNG